MTFKSGVDNGSPLAGPGALHYSFLVFFTSAQTSENSLFIKLSLITYQNVPSVSIKSLRQKYNPTSVKICPSVIQ